MKKNLFILSLAFFLPSVLVAQEVEDDLYYIPSKKKQKKVEQTVSVESDRVTVSTPGATTVVVRDTKKNVRDVDEYNRRYRARDYDFSASNDTLYIDERADSRARYDDDLDGEWVGGEFEGSADDYEYATRIIRFRNPRYAISVSSPLYWDVVYGLNSWEWNVYTDGLYAYAFPTFSNRLWWDWRYNSWGWGWSAPYYGWGWNSWYGPHWSWGWGGWYDGWHGGWGHHHHHHHHYNPGWSHGGHWGNAYTSRRPLSVARGDGYSYRGSAGTRNQVRRANAAARQDVRRASSTTTRRQSATRASNGTTRRAGRVVTTDAAGRHSTYSRPSSTRNNASYTRSTVSGNRRSSATTTQGSSAVEGTRRSASSYSRGSSTSRGTTRSYNSRSEGTSRSSSSRSYSPSRSSSGSSSSFSTRSSGSSRSSGSYSGGGGSRSSGGGGGSRRR